jgi:chromosome segregation ATPase
MYSRSTIALVVGMLLSGRVVSARAQDTTAARPDRDTPQGYAPPPEPTQAPPAASAPVAAPAAAATVPAAAPVAPASSRAAIGAQLGFVDVLPTRSSERIQALLDNAVALRRDGVTELANAQAEREKTKGLVASSKQEISSIDSKRKVAEKNKEEGEKVALQAEKKDAERRKQFLERRLDLHEAEIDRAKAIQKLATTMTSALQMEQQLAVRRAERAHTAASDPAGARRQDAVIVELEGKGLEAKRMQAEAEKQVADKDVDLAKRRLELHKAQISAAGPGL